MFRILLRPALGRGAADAEACFEVRRKNGEVMTTAFVARDLISVVDALEEDGLLRYWGERL
jgi:hypothetical protein